MKKILFPLAAVAFAMACTTSCKDSKPSDKYSDSLAKANAAAANDPASQLQKINQLQKEIEELQFSVQEEMLEKAKTLPAKEFAVYYEKFCNAQFEIQQNMLTSQSAAAERAQKLDKAFNDPAVMEKMQSPEVMAVNERMQQKMQQLFQQQMQQQMTPVELQDSMAQV